MGLSMRDKMRVWRNLNEEKRVQVEVEHDCEYLFFTSLLADRVVLES